ncbi:lymphocyte function-associated antigen 3 [Molossus molossus]|uniref:CD58 molecule n=1 Tax=Molossus molossus TaxID=27622 RepID=A0A7J8CPX5_MOLMO|nr:lymphocyte function-associated antigen 3 [Molossus molossus]KAF6412918.1 CD58 molecule [Molossus molossus]
MTTAKAVRRAAAAVNLCTLVLLLDFISCGNLSYFGTVNGNVTLAPSLTVDFKEIIWKKGKNKVVEWGSDYEVKSYPPFRGRVDLDTKLGNLIIVNLTSSDEGEYEIESPSLTDDKKFFLTILDPLPSPILHCILINESIEIHCEIPQSYHRHRQQIQYEWRCPFPPCGKGFLGIPSPLKLAKLYLQEGDLSQKVECVIENQESNRTSSMVLSTCVPSVQLRTRYIYKVLSLVLVICFVIGFLKYAGKRESTNPT